MGDTGRPPESGGTNPFRVPRSGGFVLLKSHRHNVQVYRYGRWRLFQYRRHHRRLITVWVGPYVLRIEWRHR